MSCSNVKLERLILKMMAWLILLCFTPTTLFNDTFHYFYYHYCCWRNTFYVKLQGFDKDVICRIYIHLFPFLTLRLLLMHVFSKISVLTEFWKHVLWLLASYAMIVILTPSTSLFSLDLLIILLWYLNCIAFWLENYYNSKCPTHFCSINGFL